MEKPAKINNLLEKIRKKNVINWMNKITFLHILIIWASAVVLFGLVYFFVQDDSSFLLYNLKGKDMSGQVNSIIDAVYFSFVTATTAGFGDIVPFGFFKFVATFEVLLGLMLLAVVTSKLVSIKQDEILVRVYEILFKERINRIRSSMLLFRQNMDRIMTKIEEGFIRKREINNMYMHISSLEDVLSEILGLTMKQGSYYFIKGIDNVDAELILNSILSSFEKLNELLTIMNQKNIKWDTEINLLVLNKCLRINDNLFNIISSSKTLPKEFIKDVVSNKNKAIDSIKKSLPGSMPNNPNQ